MLQLLRIGPYSIYILKNLIRMVEANSADIIDEWLERFGEIKYFC